MYECRAITCALARFLPLVAEFNALDREFRRDADAKEELHVRADELGDRLWEIVNQRKVEAAQLLTDIKSDGWTENQTVRAFNFWRNLLD